MAPPVLNTEYYNVLRNRVHRFNTFYADQLKNRTDDRFNEDIFECLYDAWVTVSMDTAGDDARNLNEDVLISEDSFEHLKAGAVRLRDRLCRLAMEKQLGERYEDKDGREYFDYTYVSHEILEICVLAMFTYTNFFQQCRYIENYGFEPATGSRRAKEITQAMFPDLRIFEVQEISQQLIDNPLHNVMLEIAKGIYKDERNYQVTFGDSNERIPYKEVKAQHDRARDAAFDARSREIERKREERKEALRQADIRSEQNRIIEEKRRNPVIGDYSVYDTFRDALDVVPNDDPPPESEEHFYAFFKQQLGIDEKDLTANTLISAMQAVHIETRDDPDNLVFCEKTLPIYRQLQAIAFETSAKKCIAEGDPIDFNQVSRKVDEVMAALYYTVNPAGFQRGDRETRERAAELLNGTYLRQATSNVSEWMREAALDRVKSQYREAGIGTFNADAEYILASYKTNGMSSKQIALDARRFAKEYTQYRENIDSGVQQDSVFEQANARSIYMNEAYALEKRIETRYASGWSRFIRMVSYRRQLNALNKIKEALGIDQNTRVADVFLEDRLTHAVKDLSDPGKVDNGRTRYNNTKESKVVEHVQEALKESMNGKELPKVDTTVYKQEETGIDRPGDVPTTHSEYLKQKALEEEKRREEEERLEKERLEKEKLERQKQEEERRRREEEEEEKARIEALIRDEKTALYQQKVADLQLKIERAEKAYNDLKSVEEKKAEQYKKESAAIPRKASDLEDERADAILDIKSLENQVATIMQLISQKVNDLAANNISAKDMKKAGKEAHKEDRKNVSKQSMENRVKVSENIESDEVLKELNVAMLRINEELEKKRASIPEYQNKINKLWREKDRLDQLASRPSEKLSELYSDLRKLQNEHKKLIDNKDKVIETGEGLGFDRDAFLNGGEIRQRESLLGSSEIYEEDGRTTVVFDDIEDEKAPVAPRVDGEEKELKKNGIVK